MMFYSSSSQAILALISCADAVNIHIGADVQVHSTAFAEQAGNVSVDNTDDVLVPSILLNNSFEHRLDQYLVVAEWLSNGASVHQIPQAPTTPSLDQNFWESHNAVQRATAFEFGVLTRAPGGSLQLLLDHGSVIREQFATSHTGNRASFERTMHLIDAVQRGDDINLEDWAERIQGGYTREFGFNACWGPTNTIRPLMQTVRLRIHPCLLLPYGGASIFAISEKHGFQSALMMAIENNNQPALDAMADYYETAPEKRALPEQRYAVGLLAQVNKEWTNLNSTCRGFNEALRAPGDPITKDLGNLNRLGGDVMNRILQEASFSTQRLEAVVHRCIVAVHDHLGSTCKGFHQALRSPDASVGHFGELQKIVDYNIICRILNQAKKPANLNKDRVIMYLRMVMPLSDEIKQMYARQAQEIQALNEASRQALGIQEAEEQE